MINTPPRVYTPLWHKYRPAILKMMVDSQNEPQSYQLSNHEVQGLSTTKQGRFTFKLEVSDGRPVSGIKESIIAQDLWEILQLSRKASELISTGTFEFSLDKQFVLHIQRKDISSK